MAPNLAKKKQPDDHRRPNIWRYISSKRFGRRGRRDSSVDENEVRPGMSGALFDDSDRSDSILINEEVEDAGSVGSEYSDAHSTWQDPSTKSEQVTPITAHPLPDNVSTVGFYSEPGGNSKHPTASASGGDTRASVISIDVPPLDMVIPRHPAQNLYPLAPHKLKRTNGDISLRRGEVEISPEDLSNPMQIRLDKGKSVEKRSDWSTAVDPWAMLESDNTAQTGEREDLAEENARLREELQHLKATMSKSVEPPIVRDEPNSPRQSPVELRSPSRAKRSRQKKRQEAVFFETTTLRDLVLKRLFTPHVIVDGMIHDDDTPVTLDTPLTATQVHDFTQIMNEVITSGRNLKQPIALCAVCHLPKFKGAKGSNQNSYVSEVLAQLPIVSASAFQDFDPVWGTSRCCRRFVCRTCLSTAIIAGISTQWWLDLSNDDINWLKCPVPCCGRSLPLYSSGDVLDVLELLGVREAASYIERFERAHQLRSKLQTLSPLPSKEEIRRSKVLHERLARFKRMWPLLDHTLETNEELVSVEALPVDTADGRGTLKIPIFTHLLRPRTSRTCVVCDETYEEFDRGHPEGWSRASRGFTGEWTWRILSFPTPEILSDCHHDHDICRDCLGRYITTQLETRGHSVVDNISCPTPDCDHKFTHTEIRHLGTPASFAVYDRYTMLNSVSSLPNFRWCLREDCTSGGLYDDPSSVPASSALNANCIECSECSFTMCYTCQSPWHGDLTCAQYASQREDSFTETQTWLAEHTKPCPGEGCGVQVQKGEGCFHMTCSRCRFEFCWECLADWRRIFVPGDDGGFLRADGHREGCFFRDQAAPLPTQVMGQDLAVGLRRLELAPPAAAAAAAAAG